MKITWEPKDIICGRIICKAIAPPNSKDLGWHAKHTYKIGWFAPGNPEKEYSLKGLHDKKTQREYLDKNRADYCLLALTDGMVGHLQTKCELAEFLTKEGYIPAPHSHTAAIMDYCKDCYNYEF